MGLVDEQPFDPVLWFENGYLPGAGGGYRGPTTLDDLKAFVIFHEARFRTHFQ